MGFRDLEGFRVRGLRNPMPNPKFYKVESRRAGRPKCSTNLNGGTSLQWMLEIGKGFGVGALGRSESLLQLRTATGHTQQTPSSKSSHALM